MKRLRILQLVTRNELRGAEVFAGQLSMGLVQRGHDVVQAGLYRMRADSQELALDSSVQSVELSGRVQGRIELRPMRGLIQLIHRTRPDLIQANGFHALKYACLLSKVGSVRVPIVYRNISIASGWARRPLKQAWGKWLCRSLSMVCSVSRASADDFGRFYQFPHDRIEVIRRGIDVPDPVLPHKARSRLMQAAHLQPQASAAENFVCHVGGFTEEKNHLGLLDAFVRLIHAVPNIRLFLFGDGPLRRAIETRAHELGLADRVHFMGFRDDARELVAGCDLMLLTSRMEGIPGVVLEAAARCVPAVCTDVGGVSEFIEHDINGCLVAAGDMQALAAQAAMLLNDPLRCRTLGLAAQSRVREQYSMSGAVDQFQAVYRRALESRSRV